MHPSSAPTSTDKPRHPRAFPNHEVETWGLRRAKNYTASGTTHRKILKHYNGLDVCIPHAHFEELRSQALPADDEAVKSLMLRTGPSISECRLRLPFLCRMCRTITQALFLCTSSGLSGVQVVTCRVFFLEGGNPGQHCDRLNGQPCCLPW